MPKANEKDLRDIPDEVKKVMIFTFASMMDEVMHIALLPAPNAALADSAPVDPPAVHAADPPPPDADIPALS